MAKLWLASSMRPYPEDEPPYYNVKELPWALAIEEQWPIIKQEIDKFIAERDKSFVSIPLGYENIPPTGSWSHIQFFFWGMKFKNSLKKCPTFNKLIKQIPGVVSAVLSRLGEHTDVPAHHGDTNAIYRCHLGIEIPVGLPECGMRVKDEERGWEDGKFLIFNDAHEHKVWNHTDKRRIIMIIDVMRPQYLHKKNLICAFVLTRYVSYFYDRFKLIRITPQFIKTGLFAGILGIIYVFKPVYNIFRG